MARTTHPWPAALASCGVLAPLVYSGAVIVASRKVPAFDHLKNFISELGAIGAPGAYVMNLVGFLGYGILILAFALALHRGIHRETGSWLGPGVLAVYGVGYIALAFSPCDPGCQAATPPSLHHRLHFLLSDLILLAAILGPFTLYARMARDPVWRSLAPATLVLPGVAWLFAEVSGVGVSGALRQRLWLLLMFIWIEVVAVRLFRLETGRVELGVSRSTC